MYGLEIYLSSRKKKMNEWKEENNKAKNKTNKQKKTRLGMGLGIKLVVELLGQMVVQFNFFLVLGIELQVWHKLGKCSSNDLHPQSFV